MRFVRLSLLIASLAPLAGCFGALAGLDGFTVGGGNDFCWSLTGFVPHTFDATAMIPPQTVGMRVVDPDNHVAAMAIYDPLPSPNVSGTLHGPLTPDTMYRVQIFADRNMNGMIDPYPTDHVWDLDFASMATSGCFTFAHGPPFDMMGIVSGRPDDPTKTGAQININHRLTSFDGRVLIMRITDTTTGTELAFYRYVIHPVGDPLPLPDILQDDTEYKLDAFLDMNENGMADPGEPIFSDRQVTNGLTTNVQFTLDLMP